MSGQTVVLLHAFPFDARLWEPQAEILAAAGWQVHVPNLPGFGGTDLLPGAPSIDSVADAILADLDHRGIERAVLGGISLGGYVAMAMLRKRPEMFTAAICCDTKASADTELARENRFRMAKAVTENPQECGRILQQAMLAGLLGQVTRDTRPEVVAQVSAWLDDAGPKAVAWYQQAMADRAESLTTLGALDIPVLILWGTGDTLSPEADQMAMLQVLRRGQEVKIAGAGHLSIVEHPAGTARAIKDFIAPVRRPG